MNDVPKKLRQLSAEEAVRQSGLTDDRSSMNCGNVESVPILPDPPASSPQFTWSELIVASLWNRLKQNASELTHSQQTQGATSMGTLWNIIKGLLFGSSPVTSLIGFVGLIVSYVGEYILQSPSFTNLTLIGLLQFLGLRFAKDASKEKTE